MGWEGSCFASDVEGESVGVEHDAVDVAVAGELLGGLAGDEVVAGSVADAEVGAAGAEQLIGLVVVFGDVLEQVVGVGAGARLFESGEGDDDGDGGT